MKKKKSKLQKSSVQGAAISKRENKSMPILPGMERYA